MSGADAHCLVPHVPEAGRRKRARPAESPRSNKRRKRDRGRIREAFPCDLSLALMAPNCPGQAGARCLAWAQTWSERVQRWAISEGMDCIEDVAFAFTTKEEADGALGEEGITLWTTARSARFDSLLAKAAEVRASCAIAKAQADQRVMAVSAWQHRKLARMAKKARRKGALRRPAVSAESDRGKAREAAVAAVSLLCHGITLEAWRRN